MKSDGKNIYEESATQVTVTGWSCKECQRFWGKDEHMARWCCASTQPCECGGRIESGWSVCKACRNKAEAERELARFQKATKVTDFDGPILTDFTSHNEGFFENLDELIDWLACEPESEIPEYVWTCDFKPLDDLDIGDILENLICEHAEGTEDRIKGHEILEKAFKEFADANKDVCSWEPNYSVALIISEEVKSEILKARADT